MSTPITRVNPESMAGADGSLGYSQISLVEPGRMAYVSGQVAWQAGGEPVPDSLAEQAKIVSTNSRAALQAIDAGPDDVVMARIYVQDWSPERQQEALPFLLATFDGVQPCVTGLGVAAIAGPGLQVEMEMIVRLPD